MRAWGVRKGVMYGGSSTSVFVPSCYCPSIAATRTLLWRRAGDVCWAQRGVSTWVRTIKAFDKEPSERNISKGSQLEMHRSALMQTNAAAMEKVLPWFEANMSPSYFHTVSKENRIQHLQTLVALYGIGSEPQIVLSDEDKNEITVIQPGEGTGFSRAVSDGQAISAINADLLKHIPTDKSLQQMKKYTALDGSITIIHCEFARPALFDGSGAEQQAARAKVHAYAQQLAGGDDGRLGADEEGADGPAVGAVTDIEARSAGRWSLASPEAASQLTEASIDRYLGRCPAPYVVRHSNPRRFLQQLLMYNNVQGTDQTEVSVERWSPADFGEAEQDEWLCSSAQVDNSARWLITVASGQAHPSLQLANLANYLGTKGLSVRRVFLDLLDDPEAAAATAAAAAPGETKPPPDPDNHESRSVMMLRLFVAKLRQQQPKSSDSAPNTLPPELCDDIRKLKWIDSHAIELAASAGLTFAQA